MKWWRMVAPDVRVIAWLVVLAAVGSVLVWFVSSSLACKKPEPLPGPAWSAVSELVTTISARGDSLEFIVRVVLPGSGDVLFARVSAQEYQALTSGKATVVLFSDGSGGSGVRQLIVRVSATIKEVENF